MTESSSSEEHSSNITTCCAHFAGRLDLAPNATLTLRGLMLHGVDRGIVIGFATSTSVNGSRGTIVLDHVYHHVEVSGVLRESVRVYAYVHMRGSPWLLLLLVATCCILVGRSRT